MNSGRRLPARPRRAIEALCLTLFLTFAAFAPPARATTILFTEAEGEVLSPERGY